MTAALADAQVYGPQTDAIAREVAACFNGCVTDINYKTRESATRKCITDNSRPYDLKDLARTTIVAGWDSIEIKPVINYLVSTETERNIFGRYKHQTSESRWFLVHSTAAWPLRMTGGSTDFDTAWSSLLHEVRAIELPMVRTRTVIQS